jgi:hypothetical protein
MAAGATGIDYDTLGGVTSTGVEMRRRCGDPAGGTTSDDIAKAWQSYGQAITIRDGRTFDDAIADLKAGRLVHIDVWHEAAEGPCLSGTGRYGHTMAIAPEQNASGKWLVSDPWCSPPKWTWWDEAKLRKGAEVWGMRVYGQATRGDPLPVPVSPEAYQEAGQIVMAASALALLDRYRPDRARFDADPEPADTGGPRAVMYTASDAHQAGGSDMAIRAPDSLTSDYLCEVRKGTSFYADAALTQKLGDFSSTRSQRYVGSVIDGSARAIIVTTSQPYDDGVDRPTVVYVKESATEPVRTGNEHDAAWRHWLDTDANAPDKV